MAKKDKAEKAVESERVAITRARADLASAKEEALRDIARERQESLSAIREARHDLDDTRNRLDKATRDYTNRVIGDAFEVMVTTYAKPLVERVVMALAETSPGTLLDLKAALKLRDYREARAKAKRTMTASDLADMHKQRRELSDLAGTSEVSRMLDDD